MEVVRLKNVKLANAIKVDVENTVFRSDNYDITLEDRFFIVVRHKITQKQTETTVYNMINMNRETVEDLKAKAEAAERLEAEQAARLAAKAAALKAAEQAKEDERLRLAEIEEQRAAARLADKERKKLPEAELPNAPTVRIKKSNKTNVGV